MTPGTVRALEPADELPTANLPLTAASGLPRSSVARKGKATPPANTEVAVRAAAQRAMRKGRREHLRWTSGEDLGSLLG
jgi:hypothetical protein